MQTSLFNTNESFGIIMRNIGSGCHMQDCLPAGLGYSAVWCSYTQFKTEPEWYDKRPFVGLCISTLRLTAQLRCRHVLFGDPWKREEYIYALWNGLVSCIASNLKGRHAMTIHCSKSYLSKYFTNTHFSSCWLWYMYKLHARRLSWKV